MATELTLSPSSFRDIADRIEGQLGRVIVGQHQIVREVLIAMIGGGHALLEGVPGLGKTMLVRTLAQALELSFSRIQFTPDLMPADITGTNVLHELEDGRRQFAFQPGPVFANLLLADEINRATPKTQSALLEAMQEGTATVSHTVHALPRPFFVLATQNPLEMEGTYPLPEAQLDRFFFKLLVPYPSAEELTDILARTVSDREAIVDRVATGAEIVEMGRLARQVPVANYVTDFAVRLVLATHPDRPEAPGVTVRYVRHGASPRGAQAIVLGAKISALLAGRANVSFDDIRAVLHPALRHRLILNFEAEASRVTADDVLSEIMGAVPDSGF
ncbi:MAG: MoxR family ATPase [Chloroflexota bacterium]|nr:MoxR family ATPase [Chloroflexota bacterium]